MDDSTFGKKKLPRRVCIS